MWTGTNLFKPPSGAVTFNAKRALRDHVVRDDLDIDVLGFPISWVLRIGLVEIDFHRAILIQADRSIRPGSDLTVSSEPWELDPQVRRGPF